MSCEFIIFFCQAEDGRRYYKVTGVQTCALPIYKCLAPFPDTIFLVNEMNKHHQLDKKLQFDFLLNSLRTRKRYTPWLKASKQKNLEYVKEYYGYNNEKARSALKVLSDEQIKAIKDSLDKGGRNNGKY